MRIPPQVSDPWHCPDPSKTEYTITIGLAVLALALSDDGRFLLTIHAGGQDVIKAMSADTLIDAQFEAVYLLAKLAMDTLTKSHDAVYLMIRAIPDDP